jgi:hypothetical protein
VKSESNQKFKYAGEHVSEKRTWPWILALSLALHAVILWSVRTPRLTTTDERTAIEMTFVEEQVKAPDLAILEVAPPAASKDKNPKKQITKAIAAVKAVGSVDNRQSTSTPQSDSPVASGTEASKGGVFLLPSENFGRGLTGPASPADEPRGQTIRNTPDEVPNADYAQFQADKAGKKINAQLQDLVGLANRNNGNGGPRHFQDLEIQIRAMLKTEKIATKPLTTAAQVGDVLETVFASGKISDNGAKAITDSALGRAVQNQIGTGSSLDDQRAREAGLQSMSAFGSLAERISRVRLRTVVETTSDAMGVLADARVVEKSGDDVFDEAVLHLSQKAARRMKDTDDKGLGTDWWLSRWQYTLEPPSVKVKLLLTRKIDKDP